MTEDAHGVDDVGLRRLAEALPHLVWFARTDGTVTYYNARASRYDGLAAGADGTYDWAPIVHPDDLERTEAAWAGAVARREEYECEHRVRMADGSFRWHISRALPFGSEALQWFGTATDTQVLVEAREALAESEARLRTVFSGIDQGYCVCELVLDDDGRPVDYLFLEANPQFEEATGLEDAVGRTALELVPDLEPHWLATYAEVAMGGEPLRFEQESAAMGRHFDVFVMPVAPLGRFALVFSDITLRKEAERALLAQRDRDHEVAVRLQEAMLPTTLAEDPQIEMAADYVASADYLQVGGDWYETFHVPDGRICLVVGDVVGHSTEAAAAMGQLRAGLLALARHVEGPGAVLDELDDFARRNRITDFATALCIFLDPVSGAVDYSSAGHPPALVCSPQAHVRWLDEARSVPLGGIPVDRRPSAQTSLESDDVLVLYSDGLVERRGDELDAGMDRLAASVQRHRDEQVHELCAAVLADLGGPTGFDDDTVVLVLRRRA